jgi:hypothetical protein
LQAAVLRSIGEQLDDWKAQVFEQFRNSLVDMARVFYAQQQEQLDVLRQELSALEQVTSKLDTLREVIEMRFGPSFPAPMLADKGAAATDLSARLGQNPIEDRNRGSAAAPVTAPVPSCGVVRQPSPLPEGFTPRAG